MPVARPDLDHPLGTIGNKPVRDGYWFVSYGNQRDTRLEATWWRLIPDRLESQATECKVNLEIVEEVLLGRRSR